MSRAIACSARSVRRRYRSIRMTESHRFPSAVRAALRAAARRTGGRPAQPAIVRSFRWLACAAALGLLAQAVESQQQRPAASTRAGDYIAAVVNQELVTAGEVQQRVDRVRAEAARSKAALPPPEVL